MRRSEVERIFTATRKLNCKLEKVGEALGCYLEDFFAPIQDIYYVIESSTGVRWNDDTWETVFDVEKNVEEVMGTIEADSKEKREALAALNRERDKSTEEEIKIFDEE